MAIGPLPSIGWPSAFTTRPTSASPTGTERMRPVALTAWPSSTWSLLPRTTAPMVSSSRFSARPSRPPSNSSSSFTAASGRPATRATPSPTSSTRPSCSCASEGEKDSMWSQRRGDLVGADGQLRHQSVSLVVGCGWLRFGVNGEFSHASDRSLELLEPVTDRAVDDGVADAGDQSPEDRRIDHDLDFHLLARRLGSAAASRCCCASSSGMADRTSATSWPRSPAAFSRNAATISDSSLARPAPTIAATSDVLAGSALPPMSSSTTAMRRDARQRRVGQRGAQRRRCPRACARSGTGRPRSRAADPRPGRPPGPRPRTPRCARAHGRSVPGSARS